ncbi:MAG TPA: hypothetical protein VKT28_17540 [Puia sp.]|nr:hypothetical protein [Puia sp.]
MLTFEFPINALILLAVIAVSMFIGFSLRRSQIAKIHKKLVKAENEMINSHAEILEIQKEYISMELKLRGIKDPVVLLTNPNDANSNEKLPNGALRKKMLTKDFTPTRNEGYNLIYDNLMNKETSPH